MGPIIKKDLQIELDLESAASLNEQINESEIKIGNVKLDESIELEPAKLSLEVEKKLKENIKKIYNKASKELPVKIEIYDEVNEALYKALKEIYSEKELIKPKEIYIKLNSHKSQLSLARKNNTYILTYYFHQHHHDCDATITIESAGAGGLFILSDILEKKFLLSEECIDKIIDEINS